MDTGADASVIGRLAAAIPAPLNVMSVPGLPDRAGLRALGVRRVSLGPRAMSATMGYLRALAREMVGAEVFVPEAPAWMSYAEIDALFAPK
jgi:2-methylisocitrate lyase-like PEP mutase family enzyme